MTISGHASGAAVYGTTIALVSLAAVAVAARLYTRLVVVSNGGVDDGFICFALLFSIATTVTMCLQVNTGMGRHMDTLSIAQGIANQKAFYVSIWVYNLSMSCAKFSILLQYLRIFPQDKFRVACYALIGIVSIYTCWTFFSAVFACWPISYFWMQLVRPGTGHCLNRFPVWFANAGINIATDIATGILPLPFLKDLELPKRQRIALMIVFGLGGFTCIVSILRLSSLYRISVATDITWENPMAAIWSSVEINTGILCSCLPTLRAFITRIFPRILASSLRRTSYEVTAGSAQKQSYDNMSSHHSRGSRSKVGFNAMGPDEGPTMQSVVRSRLEPGEDGIEIAHFGNSPPNRDSIKVVKTVEQDIEKLGDQRGPGAWRKQSDASSRELVPPTFYHADSESSQDFR